MPRCRRRRHVVLPIDNLVPQTIVGEPQVVGVGELRCGMLPLHCHLLKARIVPSSFVNLPTIL